ncbi:hypothetical protein GDO81_015307 [Engystomops pustulosus]|uniref:Uncharacterized protein n=1 Tax=Engystomops pustulosus TaxID=76066 RepID=A0AAV7AP14_ENGPU|nr:hypothetical protein GDO81_015307 [Engystomops pustulosus]
MLLMCQEQSIPGLTRRMLYNIEAGDTELPQAYILNPEVSIHHIKTCMYNSDRMQKENLQKVIQTSQVSIHFISISYHCPKVPFSDDRIWEPCGRCMSGSHHTAAIGEHCAQQAPHTSVTVLSRC